MVLTKNISGSNNKIKYYLSENELKAEIGNYTFHCRNLLTQNKKMKIASELNKANVYNFSIPAYKDITGKTVCPFAKNCIKYCYAKKGNYTYNKIKVVSSIKYQLTKYPELFKDYINTEILKKRVTYLRVHDSGDYYSPEYLNTWIEIAKENPNVIFYSYTKSHDLVRNLEYIPDNFVFIFSVGGKLDDKIDFKNEKHAKIFKSHEEVIDNGYINASYNDLKALENNNNIGLVYH